MIDVQDFLLENTVEDGVYALVCYDKKIEPTHFVKYNFGDGDWFLESPCELYKVTEVKSDIDEFCNKYAEECLGLKNDIDKKAYINEFIKPMIVNDCLYEINNFQCAPYLPKEVDDINIITEKECLEFLLKESKR